MIIEQAQADYAAEAILVAPTGISCFRLAWLAAAIVAAVAMDRDAIFTLLVIGGMFMIHSRGGSCLEVTAGPLARPA